MDSYCSRADVFRYGVPRGTVQSDGRSAVALASSNAFELEGHWLETASPVTVRAAEGSSLPSPLAAGTTYYVIRDSDARFRLATSESNASGSVAIDLTTDGGDVIVTAPLPVEELIEAWSRFVDPFIPAHATPFGATAPLTVRMVVAKLVGAELQRLCGVASISMEKEVAAAKGQLERWATGVPLRDTTRETAATNLAVTARLGTSSDRGVIP